jgi:hypothetical protein
MGRSIGDESLGWKILKFIAVRRRVTGSKITVCLWCTSSSKRWNSRGNTRIRGRSWRRNILASTEGRRMTRRMDNAGDRCRCLRGNIVASARRRLVWKGKVL